MPGYLAAGTVVVFLALAMGPTLIDVVSSPLFKEQLAGDNWFPKTPVEQGIVAALVSLYGIAAWVMAVRSCQKQRWACIRIKPGHPWV